MSLENYFRREDTWLVKTLDAVCSLRGKAYRNSEAKRALDLIISTPLFLLSIPTSAVIALAIKIEDGGPVFYQQERLDENLKPLKITKLRTLKIDADTDLLGKEKATKVISEADPRATKIGSKIRATDLEELPQFANVVLRGDLTLVGLRCLTSYDLEKIPEQDRQKYLDIYMESKPGILNLKSLFNKTPKDSRNKLRYDLLYAKNASLGLDLFLVFKAGKKIIKGIGKAAGLNSK